MKKTIAAGGILIALLASGCESAAKADPPAPTADALQQAHDQGVKDEIKVEKGGRDNIKRECGVPSTANAYDLVHDTSESTLCFGQKSLGTGF